MLLLIKGTPNVAKDAACQRRIQITTFRYDPRYRTTYASSYYGDQPNDKDITLTEWQTRIMDWFGEPAKVTPGIGYPDSTLLHYTFSDMVGRRGPAPWFVIRIYNSFTEGWVSA